MPSQYPSIQSFFRKEVKGDEGMSALHVVREQRGGEENETGDGFARDGGGENYGVERDGTDEKDELGDGFTEEELHEAMDPLAQKWNPSREYESMTVGELIPGPKAVTFIGRVVSFATIIGKSAKQPRARGWHYVGVRGEGGVVSIKLYFANQSYPLKLGQLLSIWTAFISDTSKADGASTAGILVCANLFPGRNTSDHLMIHTHSGAADVCRIPLGYVKGEPLPGLMTLEAYLNGGYDGVLDVKLLVCVKSIGAKKKIVKKDGGESDLIEVVLFDHTGETKMKCWSDLIESVKEWIPGKKTLLVSNPLHKLDYGGKGTIAWGRNTMVDVEPEFADANWLRKWADGLLRKESIGVEFPSEVWGEEDIEEAIYGPRTALFGLRDVEEWVRGGEGEVFTGWISVVFVELSLVKMWRRNICGIQLYSSTPSLGCPHCSKPLQLLVNPKIITTLIDETGMIHGGKLVWSEKAWKELLGRGTEELCEMGIEEVKMLECRMVGMRVSLCFGWEGDGGDGNEGGGGVGGRLCVLGVRS
ncbi:putative myo-inositol-1-phosphate synthase protein [Botrytis fragariae]|uniref:Putative myo-inositol-1-phosphate synthase protein n=1 Tax=Botrytis fragariae TaxID=1964551 RepID=A0A8H6EJS3_9HELO|nr:putative myo-inositol-1-phosphate synthase protein [Botrytis fragariae]KAF5874832.1 putative myo-inositol-1-phosphate synthase protein [Botrytis fragariae]